MNSALYFLLFAFAFGACLGSFINMVAVRLPGMMSDQTAPNLLRPASRCMMCFHALRLIDNIPIISFLLLRGRCACCNHRIAPQYLVVEIIAAVLAVITGLIAGPLDMILIFIFLYTLLALSLIDLESQLIPDVIVLPLLWVGLLANTFAVFTDLRFAVWGSVAAYLFLWSCCRAHQALTGRTGMGHGDFKLFATIGAWLGAQALPLVLAMACGFALLASGYRAATTNQSWSAPLPFGPWLALSGAIMIIYRANG